MKQGKTAKKKWIKFLKSMPDDASPENIEEEVLSFIKKDKSGIIGKSNSKVWTSSIGRSVFVISILLAIYTIAQITDFFRLNTHTSVNYFDLIAYSAWIIIPPAWFLFEYVWLFPTEAKLDSAQLSDLKYTHELAGKIWAGIVVLITAIIYLKYSGKLPGKL